MNSCPSAALAQLPRIRPESESQVPPGGRVTGSLSWSPDTFSWVGGRRQVVSGGERLPPEAGLEQLACCSRGGESPGESERTPCTVCGGRGNVQSKNQTPASP